MHRTEFSLYNKNNNNDDDTDNNIKRGFLEPSRGFEPEPSRESEASCWAFLKIVDHHRGGSSALNDVWLTSLSNLISRLTATHELHQHQQQQLPVHDDDGDYGFSSSSSSPPQPPQRAAAVALKKKYQLLRYVLDNIFMSAAQKSDFVQVFGKIQRHVAAWRCFIRRAKFVHNIKPVRSDKYFFNKEDLLLNDIPVQALETQTADYVSVFEKGRWYSFSRSEMMNLMNSALSNSMDFFAAPLRIKNPYTNLAFSKANLYNLYFFLKSNDHFPHLPIIDAFYACDFDMAEFSKQHEVLLRNFSLKYFVRTATDLELRPYIFDMLETYLYSTYIVLVNGKFPLEKLVSVMKPYLQIYMMSQFSLDRHLANSSNTELCKRLKTFSQLSPLFGTKMHVKSYALAPPPASRQPPRGRHSSAPPVLMPPPPPPAAIFETPPPPMSPLSVDLYPFSPRRTHARFVRTSASASESPSFSSFSSPCSSPRSSPPSSPGEEAAAAASTEEPWARPTFSNAIFAIALLPTSYSIATTLREEYCDRHPSFAETRPSWSSSSTPAQHTFDALFEPPPRRHPLGRWGRTASRRSSGGGGARGRGRDGGAGPRATGAGSGQRGPVHTYFFEADETNDYQAQDRA